MDMVSKVKVLQLLYLLLITNVNSTFDHQTPPQASDTTTPFIKFDTECAGPSPSTKVTEFKEPNPLSLSDLYHAGYFLLPVSLTFVLVNGFLVLLLCYNWRHVSDSVYYNSTLLCMLLTCSDLALSLFVGLPIGIRFSFEEKLRHYSYFVSYTEDVCFLIWEYLYILRVIAVAVISVERCVHIFLPFRYMVRATKSRVKVACGIIITLPLIRVGTLVYALHGARCKAIVHCSFYNDNTDPGNYNDNTDPGNYTDDTDPGNYNDNTNPDYGKTHYAPLTCMLDMSGVTLPGFDIGDTVFMAVLIGLSWLLILVSNIFTVVMMFDKAFTGHLTRQQNIETDRRLIKVSGVVLIIATSFALTNFPYVYAWGVHLLEKDKNYTLHFHLILLSFVSLFFHPWFYCLRMKNIRDLVSGFKRKFRSLSVTWPSVRSSAGNVTLFSKPTADST